MGARGIEFLMEPKDNVHMGKAREVILVLISCFVIL